MRQGEIKKGDEKALEQILVMENDCVRMLGVWFKPGEKTAMRTHPDHVAYVFNDGKFMLAPSKEKNTRSRFYSRIRILV
ncbi:Uncharacterised protein [uncultured archaeon]|nr:Uncharacterised protein [uncultured archaeon]